MKKYFKVLFFITLSSILFSFALLPEAAKDPFRDKVYELAKRWNHFKNSTSIDYDQHATWLEDEGLRCRYAYTKKVINLSTFSELTNIKVFTQGPHSVDKFDFEARYEFGYYNPDFIGFLNKRIKKWSKDKTMFTVLNATYQNDYKRLVRTYYLAWKHLQEQPNTSVYEHYQNQIQTKKGEPSWDLQESFRYYSDLMEKQGYDWYEANTAPGFWFRRKMDGTNKEFVQLFQNVLKNFDKEWYLKNK